MTDGVVDLVVSVLNAHTRVDSTTTGKCSCGYTVVWGKSFTLHQAQAVVAALRVAQQKRVP